MPSASNHWESVSWAARRWPYTGCPAKRLTPWKSTRRTKDVPDFEHDGIRRKPLMTKARSNPPPLSKPGRSTKSSAPKDVDACELFLAEMQARRVRLQQLLSLLHLEAGRIHAAGVPVHPRHN